MKSFTTTIFYLCILSFMLAVPVTATTIYVDGDATGANDGSSWPDAYTTLQEAITASVSGDEIWVAEGTYNSPTYQMQDGVYLYGVLTAQRPKSNNATLKIMLPFSTVITLRG